MREDERDAAFQRGTRARNFARILLDRVREVVAIAGSKRRVPCVISPLWHDGTDPKCHYAVGKRMGLHALALNDGEVVAGATRF